MRISIPLSTVAAVCLLSAGLASAEPQQTNPGQTGTQRQQQTPKTPPSTQTPSQTQRSQTSGQAAQPKTWMERAIEMSQATIAFSQLAETKAQNMAVRDYAEMLVRDHTEAVNRLKTADTTKGRTSDLNGDAQDPNSAVSTISHSQSTTQTREKGSATMSDTTRSALTREHQQTWDRLSRMSGQQFDREYIDLMVREHRNAVRLYEQEAGRTSPTPGQPTGGADTASLARELLPTMRQHLTQAEQIQKQLQSPNTR